MFFYRIIRQESGSGGWNGGSAQSKEAYLAEKERNECERKTAAQKTGFFLCPDFPMNLIHAWNVRPEQFKTGLGTVFELLPFAADKGQLQTYIRNHAEHFGNLTAEECDLLEVFIGMENLGEEGREGYRNREGGYNMCTALLEIREEGRNEGEWLKLISQVQRKMRKGKPLISIAEEP